MADLDEVEAAARQLVARHGRAAIEVAMTRATQAEKTGGALHSAALLVLSAVERLVSSAG